MIFPDTLPPEFQAEYALVHEARAVHDTASLRFSDYQTPAGPAWIVAVVRPESGSGSATVPGAYIEAETGRFVVPEQHDAVVVKEGTWQGLAAGDPSAPRTGSYSWTEPLEGTTRVPTPEDYYSPFAYGGTIVFRLEPMAEEVQQFGACRLLFPEWGRYAGEALKVALHLTELSERIAAQPASLAELGKMVTGDNGALATMAFRSILQSSALVASHAPKLLKAADVRKLSTFVYLTLVTASSDRSEWIVQLSKLVNETKEADRLLAIAYAAFAVNLFATQDSIALAAAHQVLNDLRKRVKELGIPTPENSPWSLIFKKSGIFDSG